MANANRIRFCCPGRRYISRSGTNISCPAAAKHFQSLPLPASNGKGFIIKHLGANRVCHETGRAEDGCKKRERKNGGAISCWGRLTEHSRESVDFGGNAFYFSDKRRPLSPIGRRLAATPIATSPKRSIADVEGSGTAVIIRLSMRVTWPLAAAETT
jgi:hypothetical protein